MVIWIIGQKNRNKFSFAALLFLPWNSWCKELWIISSFSSRVFDQSKLNDYPASLSEIHAQAISIACLIEGENRQKDTDQSCLTGFTCTLTIVIRYWQIGFKGSMIRFLQEEHGWKTENGCFCCRWWSWSGLPSRARRELEDCFLPAGKIQNSNWILPQRGAATVRCRNKRTEINRFPNDTFIITKGF